MTPSTFLNPHPDLPRLALVTGAGKRIGQAIAESLADAGFAVALHVHRSRDAADQTAKAIRQRSGNACVLSENLLEAEAPTRLIQSAESALGGPLGVLVNNASLFDEDHLGTVTAQAFDDHMAIHARAPLLLTQALSARLPAPMRAVVINMIDQRVWRPNPQFMTYTASKAALWTLTQTLAQDLAPRIRVNAIGPGPTLKNDHQSADDFAREVAAVPLEQGPSLEEMAMAVHFLIGAQSMTGQMLALDGGQHLAWKTPDIDLGA